MGRFTEADVDPLFVQRWSPRAFSPEPVPRETMQTILEAARWAPSSYNAQPWRFVYALTAADRAKFASFLGDFNGAWATHAPALIVLTTKTTSRDGGKNAYAAFDAGAAWMSLALQARMLGYATHAMGGIDHDKARRVLQVPPDHDVLIAIALGKPGDPTRLPEALAKREHPSPRKPLHDVAAEGSFTGAN